MEFIGRTGYCTINAYESNDQSDSANLYQQRYKSRTGNIHGHCNRCRMFFIANSLQCAGQPCTQCYRSSQFTNKMFRNSNCCGSPCHQHYRCCRFLFMDCCMRSRYHYMPFFRKWQQPALGHTNTQWGHLCAANGNLHHHTCHWNLHRHTSNIPDPYQSHPRRGHNPGCSS